MQLENEVRLSFYRELGVLDAAHGVKLVQHVVKQNLFVLKTMKIYDLRVFQYLQSHPAKGIPHIEELIEDGGTLYVIEEYISGESLRTKLDQDGPLSDREAADVIRQLCEILRPLHSQSPPIVHRDIKPGNIILRYSGEVVLVDFNSAKKTSASQSRDTILIGTAGYAAPEQYGFSSSRPTADLFALGVLLNELLTGSLPGEKLYDGWLRTVIQTCTQMDPANRYGSVDALLSDLSSFLHPEEPSSKPSQTDAMRFLPPGFRSASPPAMILATLWYFSILYLCRYVQVEEYQGVSLFFFRLMFLTSLIGGTLWFGNYLDVWQYMPFSKSDRPGLRLFGVVLWGFTFWITTFILGCILTSIFFG